MRVLAISGSLRKASLNTAALVAAVDLAPTGLEIVLYRGLRDLPLYDYDLDTDLPPRPVADLRLAVASSSGLLIASPEYAHGIAGPMKNALDWIVGDIAFPNKPVALWNCAPRAVCAQRQLRDVLKTMSADIIDEACIVLPLLGTDWTAETIAASADVSRSIQTSFHVFHNALRRGGVNARTALQI